MQFLKALSAMACALSAVTAITVQPRWRVLEDRALDARQSAPPNRTLQYFDQKIDHFPSDSRYKPHDKGTFKQRYYVSTEHYKPGGPVFLYLGGEGPIDGDTHLDKSLISVLMQRFNGMAFVLENRYYGESCPYNTSSTDELRFLTTEQVIADHDYFAKNVKVDGISGIKPNQVPWITYGGSYPGALSAFTIKRYPETFWAGISSSGVIHGVLGYPDWYTPIQEFADQDCMASINDIVDKMDYLVETKNTGALKQLQEIFGLSSLKDIRDFAQTIAFPIGGPFIYPTNSWQEMGPSATSSKRDFFDFCRNVTDLDAPANVTKVDGQLAKYTHGQPWTNLGNYAAYIKRVVLPLCPSGDYNSADCFGTQHPEHWANTTSNYIRSYLYTTCTEFGAYQAAFPKGQKSLISRVIDTNYTQQWCNWAFPKGKYNSIPATPDLDRWNVYGDFHFDACRLFFVDGSHDPWRDLCYHSHQAPKRYWTQSHPEQVIEGAGHVCDLRSLPSPEQEGPFFREILYTEIRQVQRWLIEWKATKGGA